MDWHLGILQLPSNAYYRAPFSAFYTPLLMHCNCATMVGRPSCVMPHFSPFGCEANLLKPCVGNCSHNGRYLAATSENRCRSKLERAGFFWILSFPWKKAIRGQNLVLLLRSSIGGSPITDDGCVCDHFLIPPATWAATFCLQGFNLVCAVLLCDHITGGEYDSLRQTNMGSFNVHTNCGCHTHEGRVRLTGVCTSRVRGTETTVFHNAPLGDQTQGLQIKSLMLNTTKL